MIVVASSRQDVEKCVRDQRLGVLRRGAIPKTEGLSRVINKHEGSQRESRMGK
jgi:hypothetical protein